MKQKQYVLPVQCVRCGATFDLWHDLLGRGESVEKLREGGLGYEEHFCWNCRNLVSQSREEPEPGEIEFELTFN